MPMLAVSGKRMLLTPISSRRNLTTFSASGVPVSHSMPA